MKVGLHVSIAGSIDKAVDNAVNNLEIPAFVLQEICKEPYSC